MLVIASGARCTSAGYKNSASSLKKEVSHNEGRKIVVLNSDWCDYRFVDGAAIELL